MEQPSLRNFFPIQTQLDRETTLRREFDNFRIVRCAEQRRKEAAETNRRRQYDISPLHADERTTGLLTQNVRGFGRSEQDREDWLASFKRQHSHGQFDVVFLQETHVNEQDISELTRLHAAQWGYRVGQGSQPLSYWRAASHKTGGVGILLHPRSKFRELVPCAEDHWTDHFMALQGEVDGHPVVLCNVYAPVEKAAREAFYSGLASIQFPSAAHLYIGGDFNSTLYPDHDRSFSSAARTHDSPALRRLLDKWCLTDSTQQCMPEASDAAGIMDFHKRYHTYSYSLPGLSRATSRLDRWYVSDTARLWATATELDTYGLSGDHKGVILHLRNPANPVRIKRQPRVFPVQPYAIERVDKYVRSELATFEFELEREDYTAEKVANAWDKLKHKIALGILRHKKAAKKSLKNTYRKKLKRLYRRYDQQMDREAVAVQTGQEGRGQLQGKASTDLLHVISETKRNWLRSRQRRLFRSHTWRRGQTTKAMFQRISCRFGDNIIPTLRPAEGHPKRGVFEKAEILADAWSPILQGSATRAGKATVVEWMQAGPTDDVGDLETQTLFTTDSITAAFKACKLGKACGPDRLGNDWYIQYSPELIPLTLKLFQLWYNAHVCPKSFLETDVFCLKKTGDGSNPLNYRPLSLLNTDYKLFTRVIATAFRRTLDSRVHPHQHGFVPSRDIRAVLDYYMAAQATVPHSPELRDAVVLLLDFAKAYDTLDREFIYAVLSRHGYPPHLVEVIRTLHTGTSGQFLANGSRSRKVPITRGIRQGCPLAPMLFILALEPLYQQIDRAPFLQGIRITTNEMTTTLKVGGYADDTALYFSDPCQITRAIQIVNAFGAASGLLLNVCKTIAIALHPDGLSKEIDWIWQITLQPASAFVRYLGLQVGSTNGAERSWYFALDQLKTRIRLASQKTLTIEQRALVASAVILAKLLYIARHAWPTTSTVRLMEKYIKNYVWHGVFGTLDIRCTTWMTGTVAGLRRKEGGLAIPDLRAELLALAAVTVSRWGSSDTTTRLLIGDVLIHNGLKHAGEPHKLTLGSTGRRVTGFRVGRTLWTVGRCVLGEYGGSGQTEGHAAQVASFHSHVEQQVPTSLVWDDTSCELDLTGMLGSELATIRNFLATHYESVQTVWLPYLNLNNFPLYTTTGVFQPDAKMKVMWGRGILGGILGWHRTSRTNKFPEILYQREQDTVVPVTTKPLDTPFEVHTSPATTSDGTVELSITTGPGPVSYTCIAGTSLEASILLQQWAGQQCRIEKVGPHPALHRLVDLRRRKNAKPHTRQYYKDAVRASERRIGLQEVANRKEAWTADNSHIAEGLGEVDWTDIRTITGATVWATQLLYRIKMRAYSTWDSARTAVGCPLPECRDLGITKAHIWWGCRATRPLWREFLGKWTELGLQLEDNDSRLIFGFRLPMVPTGIWTVLQQLYGNLTEAQQEEIYGWCYDTLNEYWRLGVLHTLQAIWNRRCRCSDATLDNSIRRSTALLRGRLHQGRLTLREIVLTRTRDEAVCRAAWVVHAAFAATSGRVPEELRWRNDREYTILFSDGGARGNPGPGGAGSIIVVGGMATKPPVILWMGSVSLAAAATTNNVAEYKGLLFGLRKAQAYNLNGLHVVGDSNLILGQMRRRKEPKARHLQGLYRQCRTIADRLNVASWRHHLRHFNKIADALANIAMDSKKSTQTSQADVERLPPRWASVKQALRGDTGHWLEMNGTAHVDQVRGDDG